VWSVRAAQASWPPPHTNTSRLRTSPALKRIPGRPWGYVPHAEMAAYFEDLTDRLDLRRRLRLNWRVVGAVPDEAGGCCAATAAIPAGAARSYVRSE
jgi:cation diffusion facilitator CzcD-associated flavoprotein CzcO